MLEPYSWLRVKGIALDQIRSFTKVRDILRKVSTALGHKRSQVTHNLKANGIAFIDLGQLGLFAESGIHVLPLVTQLCKPGIMVNASTAPLEFVIRNFQVFG